MLFIHAQLSSYAKQAVVICSIVATLLWYSGMIMCAKMFAETCRHILNAKISQFSQPQTPASGMCQTRTPLLKSQRMGLTSM